MMRFRHPSPFDLSRRAEASRYRVRYRPAWRGAAVLKGKRGAGWSMVDVWDANHHGGRKSGGQRRVFFWFERAA